MKPRPWTHDDIRRARCAPLAPLLAARGLRLMPLANDNYQVVPGDGAATDIAGLVIKHSFWIWPDRNISGNAIDYFVKVEGMTFNQAMQIILVPRRAGTATGHYDATGSNPRQTTERARHNPEYPTTANRQELR